MLINKSVNFTKWDFIKIHSININNITQFHEILIKLSYTQYDALRFNRLHSWWTSITVSGWGSSAARKRLLPARFCTPYKPLGILRTSDWVSQSMWIFRLRPCSTVVPELVLFRLVLPTSKGIQTHVLPVLRAPTWQLFRIGTVRYA